MQPKFIREYLYSLNTYSYNEDLDLAVFSICDFGDVNVSHTDYEFTNNNIYKATYVCYEKSKLTIILGEIIVYISKFLIIKGFY